MQRTETAWKAEEVQKQCEQLLPAGHTGLSTHFSGASAPSIGHVQGAPSAGTEGLGEDIQVENGAVNTNLVMQNSRVSVPFRIVA